MSGQAEQQLRVRTGDVQPPGHVDLTAGGQVGDEAPQVAVKLVRLVFILLIFVGEISVEQQPDLVPGDTK